MTVRGRTTLRFPPRPSLELHAGCVVSSCPIASALGARVLQDGGNAVDAAVATALGLTVTYPQAGNIGGGGFMLIHIDGDVHMLDYRERAPARVHAALYDDEGADVAKSSLGALSVAVPGTIAGLAEALAKFGTWAWADLVALVVPLAEVGIWLTARQASSLRLYREWLERFEPTRQTFLPEGRPPQPGTLFVQRDLAETLRALAADGPEAFYRGAIAERIVAQLARFGGVLDRDDLAAYRPVWRAPLRRSYHGHDVYVPSLPSAGGVVTAFALGCAEALDVEAFAHGSPEWVRTWARIFRVAFHFGNQLAGDPDFLELADVDEVHRIAEQPLTRAAFERIEATLASAPLAGDAAAAQRPSTTHFSILDRYGMAVSNTYSINTLFGSKLTVDGGGFLLNNTIADFRIASGPNWYGLLQGERNRLATHRRPASSMTPTLVVRDGEVTMAIGGSGGPRIPTAIAQVLGGAIGAELPLADAVQRPRVHHQLFPDDLLLERGMPSDTIDRLNADGEPVAMVNALGFIAAIRRRLEDNEITAVLDPRFGDFW